MNSSEQIDLATKLEGLDFAEQLPGLLESRSFKEIQRLVTLENFINEIHKNSSEIIMIVAGYLNESNLRSDPELFNCCEDVIYQIAKFANPEEVLIDFIEHAEKNDNLLFPIMLKGMKIALLRINEKQGFQLLWCFNTIIRHLNHMELGEDFKLEGEECVLLENTDSSKKLEEILKCVLDFCKTFCNELLDWPISHDSGDGDIRNLFLLFLLKLFGRPLVYMNLEVLKMKGPFRLLAEEILNIIIKFKTDLMYFLNFVTAYNSKKKEVILDVTDVEYNNISLAVFYYLIFKEKLLIQHISHVYDPIFIFNKLATLSIELLNISHSEVHYKGLQIIEAALERIADFALGFSNAQSNIYGELSESICKIMIYSDVKKNRLVSVSIFKSFLFKFDSKGRFIILLNIQNKVNSPNFIGYIIPITKDLILKALNEKHPADLEYFTGQNLRNLLKKFCYLHKGAESDLIELSDQVISSLNLLRFLFIRDKQNLSGIADLIPYLEEQYLEPLKTGLSLSVAHYKFQKTELDNAGPEDKVNISIAGTQLPPLPKNQKIEILIRALSTFDLMESLRARTQECLEDFKLLHSIK